jgi:hypothetical protein
VQETIFTSSITGSMRPWHDTEAWILARRRPDKSSGKSYGGIAVVLFAAGVWSNVWLSLLLKFAENIIT